MSKTITIDSVVRSVLMDIGYPMQYYFRVLHFALRGLSELSFDLPLNIKEVKLSLSTYGAVIVPTDFVDVVKIGQLQSGAIKPFVVDESLTGLYNYDETGKKVKYTSEDSDDNDVETFTVVDEGMQTNSNGEYLGRRFGLISKNKYAYKYFPERNEIQFHPDFSGTEIVLTYISDGLSSTVANVIHPYAVECLKNYIHLQRIKHDSGGKRSPLTIDRAKQEFSASKKVLKARMNNMGLEEIVASLRMTHFGLKN